MKSKLFSNVSWWQEFLSLKPRWTLRAKSFKSMPVQQIKKISFDLLSLWRCKIKCFQSTAIKRYLPSISTSRRFWLNSSRKQIRLKFKEMCLSACQGYFIKWRPYETHFVLIHGRFLPHESLVGFHTWLRWVFKNYNNLSVSEKIDKY